MKRERCWDCAQHDISIEHANILVGVRGHLVLRRFGGLRFFHGFGQRLLKLGARIGGCLFGDVIRLLEALPFFNWNEYTGDFALIVGKIFYVHG